MYIALRPFVYRAAGGGRLSARMFQGPMGADLFPSWWMQAAYDRTAAIGQTGPANLTVARPHSMAPVRA